MEAMVTTDIQRATFQTLGDVLFETPHLGVICLDTHSKLVSANSAALNLLALSLAQLQGTTPIPEPWSATQDDGAPFAMEHISFLESLRSGIEFQNAVIGISGPNAPKVKWVYASSHAVTARMSETVTHVCTLLKDITEVKNAQNALRVSDAIYKNAFSLTPDSMNINRLQDGLFVSVNPAFCRIMGYAESDVIGNTSVDLDIWANPGDREQLVVGLKSQGFATNVSAMFRTKAGELRHGLMSAAIIKIDDVDHIISITRDITELKQLEIQHRLSEERFRRLMEDLPGFYVTFLPDGRLTFVNEAIANLVNMPKESLTGKNFFDFLTPEDRQAVQANLATLSPLQPVETHEQTHLWPGQEPAYHQWTNRGFFDADGRALYFQAIGADITERKKAQDELRVAAIAFESQVGMTVTDSHGTILKVNQSFVEITGYSADEAVGQNPRLLSSGRHGAEFYADMWKCIGHSGTWAGEIWNRRKNGDIYPEWLTITAVYDNAGRPTHFVGTFLDITSRKRADDQIKALAFYDPLTRLPNRRLLMDRLEIALAACNRHQRRGALLFIDLDNFKTLNDTLGHHQGDLLLVQVAARLSSCVREGDTVARIGGDEFVVMLEDLSIQEMDAAKQAEVVGEKVQAALRQTYQIGHVDHHSTACIGITLFGGSQTEGIDEPLKRADIAMYEGKIAGRNTIRFFDPQMQAAISARAALEAGMREALEKNQFLLYYQPQISDCRRVVGVEALIRWQHPEKGIVPPSGFIAQAEESDLILLLGEWVLNTACTQLAKWAKVPQLEHLTVAVNVSARQFHHPDFSEQVIAVLDRTGANPKRLKLELTESLLINDVDDVIVKMGSLKALGVGFSLDDFGTGYSSLAYLKRLPLDQLKIDQGFVSDILINSNDAAISKMIIVLAESMGLTVIAEGVETEAQWRFLASQGCQAYQGYFFGKPVPPEELEKLIVAANADLIRAANS